MARSASSSSRAVGRDRFRADPSRLRERRSATASLARARAWPQPLRPSPQTCLWFSATTGQGRPSQESASPTAEGTAGVSDTEWHTRAARCASCFMAVVSGGFATSREVTILEEMRSMRGRVCSWGTAALPSYSPVRVGHRGGVVSLRRCSSRCLAPGTAAELERGRRLRASRRRSTRRWVLGRRRWLPTARRRHLSDLSAGAAAAYAHDHPLLRAAMRCSEAYTASPLTRRVRRCRRRKSTSHAADVSPPRVCAARSQKSFGDKSVAPAALTAADRGDKRSLPTIRCGAATRRALRRLGPHRRVRPLSLRAAQTATLMGT
jgi:hypothetical protein